MTALSSVFLEVRPDTTKFGADLKRKLAGTNETVNVAAKLDSAQFKQNLDALKRGLKDIAVNKARIDANSAGATAKVKELKAQLGRLNEQVKIDGNTRGISDKISEVRNELKTLADKKIDLGVDSAKASAQMRAIKAQAVELDRLDPTIDVDVKGGKGPGGSFDLGAVLGATKIPAIVTALSLAGTAVASLGAAAVGAASAAAPLTGLVAAYPAVMLAGAQGLGVLKLATSGLSDAITVLMEPGSDPAAVKEALKGLSPAARTLATDIASLAKGPLQDLKVSTQTAIAPGFSAGLRAVAPLFPVISRQATGTAQVIGNLGAEAGRTMGTPFFSGQLERIMGTNNVVLRNGGFAALSLGHALIDIVDAFRPVLVSISEYVMRGAGFIETSTRAGLVTGRLGAFFQRSWRLAQAFGSVLADLAIGLFNVGRQSTVMGNFLGKGLAEAASKFRAWTSSVKGERALRAYFEDSIPVVREVIKLIRDIAVGFSGMAANPTLVPVLAQIRTQLLPAIQELAGGVTTAFGPALVSAATAFVEFNNALTFSPLAAVLQIMADAVIRVSEAISGAPAPINTMLATLLALGLGLKVAAFSASSLASTFGPLITAIKLVATAQGRALVMTKLSTAATVAQTVAAKVAAVASRAWAAGQWLLNAALTANPIGLVVVGIAALVAGLVIAYKKSETFRAIVDKAFSVLKKVAGSVLSWFVGNVIPFFTRKLPAAFQAVLAWVKARWGQVRVILTEPMARALVALRATWDKITAKFKSARDWVAGAFRSAWAKVRDYLKNPIESARTLIQTWFTRITNNFKAVRDWVAGAFRTSWQRVRDFLKNPIEAARNLIQTWFSRITNNFKAVRDWVSGAFRTGWARVRDYLKNPIESARNFISTWFTRITNNFKAVRDWATNTFKASWARVASVLTSPVESARDKIQNIFGRGGPVRTAFSNAVAAIKTIWDGLEAAAKKPVRFVVNTVFAGMVRVINKIPGVKDFNVPNVKFARGGIMPGYTPGRDVHKFYSPTAGNLELSGGEPIMRPEFGQAVGKQWVDKYNHLAATGGVSAVKRAMMAPGQGNRFAGGGVFWPTVGRRTSTYAGHDGVDINQPPGPNFGAPIFAYRSGRITYAGSGRGYGNAVFEKADTGPTVVYGHMSRIRARAGQVVRGGQVIGNVGATGNASGPHLHFGIPGGSYSAAMGLLRGGKSTRGGSPGGSGNPGGYYDTVKQYPDFKDPTPGIRGSLAGWVNKLKGLGGFGPAMSGIPGNVFGKVFAAGGWVKKQISSALNAVKKVWHAVTSYSGAGTTAGGGGDGRLVPIMRAAFKFARETMGIKTIYGYSNRNIGGTNTKSDHAYGKALDLMGAKQAVADYFATGAGHRRFNIENTIYNRRIHNARGWHAYTGSSPHTDHVHIDTYDRGGMARGRGALMKNTLRPERVLSPGQTESFDRLVATLESRGNVGAAGPFINHAIIRETVDLDRYERQRAFRERMTNVG